MDFLDPKRKKAHRRRLLIGYLLMSIAVAMGTLILLFSAYGYDIDRKTGGVIQNGTVFVDSQPGGSTIMLDGVAQSSKTAAKLVLPGSRQYTMTLTNEGYEDWSRTFSLEGGHIERLTYPLLVPKQLVTTDKQLYGATPGISSQSPDRRWVLVQQPGSPLVFDLYDLNNPSNEPAVVTIPSNLLTDPTQSSIIHIVEWANDNNHVLLDREYASKHEFLLIDTENVANGMNVNTTFGVSPTIVRLRDKKADLLHIYTAEGGILRSADVKSRTLSAPLLSNALGFKSYGMDLILYVTKEGAAEGKANFRIRDSDKGTYLLREVPDSAQYLMDVTEYDGTPFYVIGSGSVDAVFVYRDPLPVLKGQRSASLLISTIMRIHAPQFVSFSDSSQFIAAQSGNNVAVLDLEADRQFTLDLPYDIPLTDKLAWMDGSRFAFVTSGTSYMVDFDGSNQRKLVPASPLSGPYFAPDYKTVFTLAPSASVSGRFAFTQTSLIKK